jgi:hypothetical protein
MMTIMTIMMMMVIITRDILFEMLSRNRFSIDLFLIFISKRDCGYYQ